ncbi:MAG: coproporphyrinogen III oxidase, partial [Chloroflexota bacterium]
MRGPRAPVALYVHVPFCLSICPYCDFVVYAGSVARGSRSRTDAFLAALEIELELRANALPPEHPPLASLYIGGGTPSLLAVEAIAR